MDDCLFCKIAAHAIPVSVVYEDGRCLVFPDINPQAPKHLLLIPKQHFDDIRTPDDALLGHLFKVAATLAEEQLPKGFRIVVNTGPDGGQTVGHLHLHLLGGRPMGWPPG